MKQHIHINKLIPDEQKGCVSNALGTIDQLLINQMVLNDAKEKNKDLSVAWIDYSKAFDSIPHDWLIKSLEIHKFDDITINFFKSTMKNWNTTLHVTKYDEKITTDPMNIKTGIFQGDSPSGLHFIICLLPLSWLLRKTNIGYRIGSSKTVHHLFFMDDLKLFANNDARLESLITVVKQFSDDIEMKFGLDKCSKLTIKKGKIITSENIQLNTNETIATLDNSNTYKYLGIEENNVLNVKVMKSKLKNEYFVRLKKILKSSLNSKNLITAINTYAVPAISYGFAVLDWSITELDIVDRETRNMLKSYHLLHNKSNITRLYIPRREGGRGLIQIASHYKSTIINTNWYIQNSSENLITMVKNYQTTRGERSIATKAKKYCTEINLVFNELLNKDKHQVKYTIKQHTIKKKIETLNSKLMHGQFQHELNQPYINKKLSNAWISDSRLKGATESIIFAIQEQAITTRYIEKHTFNIDTTDVCRACNEHKETIHHIISGCPILAPTKYLQRHNNLAKYIYLKLAKKYDILQNTEEWYNYDPPKIIQNEQAKLLWDFAVQTDHTINHNKPDIIIHNKFTNKISIIDIAIPNDYNVVEKRAEKIRKYVDLAIEIKTLWNVSKVDIVPIIIGANGIVHGKFQDDYRKLDIEVNIREIQKITLLGTAHIIRAFFQIC